jgi:predicted glutamine amidotransferase
MCIAILNTKQATLGKETLRNCWENNGDGAGILYIGTNKKMSVFKEMNSFDNFYENYIDLKKKYGRRNMVLHFRISTHGKVNETNCHPFLVDDNIGFVHNGMIYDVPNSTEYSDTYMFNETILKNLKEGFEYNDTVLDMLDTFIGAGSKLIFLNKDNHYAIVNEKAGHWNMGCWFSNSSYKQVNSYVDYGGVRKSKSSLGYGWGGYNTWDSYRDYGSGSSYHSNFKETTSKQQTVWSDFEDIPEVCSDCGITLMGMNEIEAGTCHYCQEEALKLQAATPKQSIYKVSDTCDCCTTVKEVEYNAAYNAFMCQECTDFLGA